ncbi:DUF1752-like protein [Alternaria alternata]|nr:DUF1752-like protein [Alternaria alternata]
MAWRLCFRETLCGQPDPMATPWLAEQRQLSASAIDAPELPALSLTTLIRKLLPPRFPGLVSRPIVPACAATTLLPVTPAASTQHLFISRMPSNRYERRDSLSCCRPFQHRTPSLRSSRRPELPLQKPLQYAASSQALQLGPKPLHLLN